MKSSFDKTWDSVYFKKKAINQFPFSDFVSFFFNTFKKNSKLNILEIGCGSGNNLEFLAKLGHNVYGIDASKEIIKIAKKKFLEQNLDGNFTQSEFTKLPYDDNFFDLIIDRASICHTDIQNAEIAINSCNRVLKPGSVMYSTLFTNFNSFKATKIDEGFYKNFVEGFKNIGQLKFYNSFELKELFEKNNFIITKLFLLEKKDMLSTPADITSEWILHLTKIIK